MSHQAITLGDNGIAYDDNGEAHRVSGSIQNFVKMTGVRIFGAYAFTNDESVHADYWEMHPHGDEILHVLEGRLLATLEREGVTEEVVVAEGQALIVPRRSWHRLQVLEPGRLVFFTPGAGSELRPHNA